jgi:hypothetical protein
MKHSFGICVVVIMLLTQSPGDAALKETTPSIVCKFLNAKGLMTGSWKDYGPGGSSVGNFGCHSPYQELGTGSSLKNNLAYYVEGQPSKAGLLYLVLNVNDKSQAVLAHKALLKAAELLAHNATGTALPENIRQAITRGSKASASSAGSLIRVIRIDWPTGRGYEIKVFFE